MATVLTWASLAAPMTAPGTENVRTAAAHRCEVHWRRIHGKDEEETLHPAETYSLLDFARGRPSWEPVLYDRRGAFRRAASKSALSWTRLGRWATLERVGRIAGRRVYLAKYSPFSIAVLVEMDGWTFCPALLLDADAGWDAGQVVASLGAPEIFRWQGTEVVSLRVYYEGNGALQESVFLAVVDGALVHLRQEPGEIDTAGWIVSSHGGGFCRHSLTWATQTWGGSEHQGNIRFRYRIHGRNLVVESVSLTPCDQPVEPCDPYYETRRRALPGNAR